jgi:acetyltransferase
MTTTGALPPVSIRPIRSDDAAALERFYVELSEDSRRLRFFGATRGLSHTQSTTFCTTDHDHREGFVATVAVADGDNAQVPGAGERIVGHICLEPAGSRRAEMAIAVADEFQRAGIGRRLIEAALEWARRARVATLTATMLTGNAGIHRLVLSLGLPTRIQPSGPDASFVEIDVPSTPALAA